MMAPSILASSDSRCGLNAASSRKPPEQMFSTSGPSPTTIRAPIFDCRMRSSPSRKGLPGATTASASSSASLSRPVTPEVYLSAIAGLPAMAAASSASRSVAARITSMPSGSGGDSLGTMARR